MAAPEWFRAEPYECWFSSLQPRYWGDINFVLEFDGRLDVDRLGRALRAAIAAEPTWGYRFVETWFYPYWRRATADELRTLVRVAETGDVAAELNRLLSQPLDATTRALLIHGPDRDTLLLRTDHRLGDASSARAFLNELRQQYRANAPEPVDLFARPVSRPTIRLLRHLTPVEQRKKLAQEANQIQRASRRSRAFQIPPATDSDPYAPTRLLHYPAGVLDELKSLALRERATLVMALQAAAYLAVRDLRPLSPVEPVPVFVNIDLRRYLTADQQPAVPANLVGDEPADLLADPQANFREILAMVREQMARRRGPRFGLVRSHHALDVNGILRIAARIPHGISRALLQFGASRMRATPRLVVSDLGAIGEPGEAWGDARLRHGHCSIGYLQFLSVFIGVSTCGSQFTLSIGSGPRSWVTSVAERVNAHLCAFAGWNPDLTRQEWLGEVGSSPDHD